MTTRAARLLAAMMLFGSIIALSGCGAMTVRSWDRDLLAEKAMSFVPSPMESAVDEHIYFSKEGSMGGADVSGGGCGCN